VLGGGDDAVGETRAERDPRAMSPVRVLAHAVLPRKLVNRLHARSDTAHCERRKTRMNSGEIELAREPRKILLTKASGRRAIRRSEPHDLVSTALLERFDQAARHTHDAARVRPMER